MKKVALVFLGDFFYDARCINMALSLKKNYAVFVFSHYKKIHSHKSFDKINFIKIQPSNFGILRYWEHYNKTLRALRKHDFDIIIACDVYSLASSIYAKPKQKVVYDCREIYSALSAHQKKPIHRCLLAIYEKYFLQYVNNALVTAETDLHYLKKKYNHCKNVDWQIIYNYPTNYSPQAKVNIYKLYNIPTDNKVILYQGVVNRGRGVGQLIKLIEKTTMYSALIVGDGAYKKYYIKLATSLNVLDRVHFVSKVPYLKLFEYTFACNVGWSVISSSSISYKFALPNKLFEYMLCGLPTIASNLPNIQKIILKYSSGEIVESHRLNQQIKAVNRLCKTKICSLNYRSIAKKHFTWDIQHKKFLQIIKG